MKFEWEILICANLNYTYRAKVIGGWVLRSDSGHMIFISDPNYEWSIE